MAFDPQRPKPDGKLRLPRTDGGMNKLAPSEGHRGEDEKTVLGEKEADKSDHLKIIERARKRFDRANQAENTNRKDALEDLKFEAGDQWPADVQAQRNADKRPCLTINKCKTFVHQITNDLRQNRPTINVSPVGDKGDVEVAKMYRGLIRAIERDSRADIAYDTAAFNAVSNGWGYFRILTKFEQPDSFDQIICVQRIRNPFTVYLDPDHQEPDGSDAKWAFVSEMIPRNEFEETYPDADPVAFDQAGVGENMRAWMTTDAVRIAEYFELSHEKRTLVALSNGHVGWEDELSDDVAQQIADKRIEVLRTREADQNKVTWYKLTVKEILEEKEWPSRWIPLVKVIGDEIDIEGKVKYSGIIRDAKDPQRMINYWRTLETELIALAPKAPWIMEEGQVEGHETQWKQANVKSYPYLLYKGTNVGGKQAPPPQRQAFAGVPQGVAYATQAAAQDMMATTGIRFDATINERMVDESGKAIRELRRSGDFGAFHYVDNLSRSLKHAGDIFIDLIPKIYDTKRIITILREDDTEEMVQIDPHAQLPYQEGRNAQRSNKILKIYNPTSGQYGVTVTIGPSYATKRIEASENMMNFAKAMPQTAMLIADLIAKNQDWPGADEMAARLAKAVPPQLLTPDQKDVPPQIQAFIQALQTHIQQLGMQLQQAMAALNDKTADRAQRQDEIDKAYSAKITATEEKFAEAMAALAAKMDQTVAKETMATDREVLKAFMASLTAIRDKSEEKDKEHEQDRVTSSQEWKDSHEKMLGALTDLTGHISAANDRISKLEPPPKPPRPKGFNVKRGKDGLIEEAFPEYDGDLPTGVPKSFKIKRGKDRSVEGAVPNYGDD
jgi:Phage P22-like portal protein